MICNTDFQLKPIAEAQRARRKTRDQAENVDTADSTI